MPTSKTGKQSSTSQYPTRRQMPTRARQMTGRQIAPKQIHTDIIQGLGFRTGAHCMIRPTITRGGTVHQCQIRSAARQITPRTRHTDLNIESTGMLAGRISDLTGFMGGLPADANDLLPFKIPRPWEVETEEAPEDLSPRASERVRPPAGRDRAGRRTPRRRSTRSPGAPSARLPAAPSGPSPRRTTRAP